MRSPETATGIADSGSSAGPFSTSPVAASNLEPWHGQSNSAPGGGDHALLVRADRAEGHDLARRRLGDERRRAVDGGVDAAADGHVRERRDVLADWRRVGRRASAARSSVRR